MGTSESRPLELIYGKFLRALETGDVECALDLMAMGALAAWSTPGQTEHLNLRKLARRGVISTECADIRRNQDFDIAALLFAVNSAGPLANALPADVGASMARRRGWIYAWERLMRCGPDASSNSKALTRYFGALSDFAEFPSLFEPTSQFSRLAGEVELEFADYWRDPGRLPMKASGGLEADLADDEGDGFENETRLIDEFESFLDGGETAQALNLLAISWFSGADSELDAEALRELLAKSGSLIRDKWNDSTEIDDLLSRLWVTAYSELSKRAGDKTLDVLGLPGFEPELLPLSNAQQQLLQSSFEEYEARQSGQIAEVDDEVEDVEEADEADAENLEDADAPPASENPRSSLVGVALRHLDRSCGALSGSSVLAERAVDTAHQIWAAHATITASWKEQAPDRPGYGGRIQADLAGWAGALAAEKYPSPVDTRPTPQKRGRRIYESVWAWTITAGILAAVARVHEGFWFAIGLGALLGYLLSSNYDSITAPRLTPLPDPAAEPRSRLEKALLEIGVHVALEYDSAEYASSLTPSELRQLVNDAWQPQGPPPPRMTSCTHREAEYVAAQWMRYLGATSCRVTQASRDGGMDIVSDTHVAEVKHHQSPVGVNFVRQIYGAATGASKQAVFFSLSEFTRSAEEFANTNSIPLFRFDPQRRTLTAKSQSALLALQHGLTSGMNLNKAATDGR